MAEVCVKNKEDLAFQFKGSLFTLTVLSLYTFDLDVIEAQLRSVIQSTPKFFENAPIVLDFSDIQAQINNLIELENAFSTLITLLKSYKLLPVGIRGASEVLKTIALKIGLAPLSSKVAKAESSYGYRVKKSLEKYKNPEEEHAENIEKIAKKPVISQETDSSSPIVTNEEAIQQATEKTTIKSPKATQSLVITDPVRSGQQIYARDTDLIVLAPVSHGAELLADGNIHIYGSLNGRALAGVQGNEKCHIFCKKLDAELIAIAGHYQVKEDIIAPPGDGMIDIYYEDGRLKIQRR
jgi:septum site-determining protein MinC